MGKVVEYKIERRIEDVVKNRKWLFFCEYEKVPVWCLVEYGTYHVYSNGGSQVYIDEFDYQKVILKSQDEDYIKQEFRNFTEGLR